MVESFMTDKDAAERNTISKFFKNAVLLLCYFHAVKAYVTGLKRTHNINFDYLRTYLETAKVKIFVKEQIRKIICGGMERGLDSVRVTLSREEIAAEETNFKRVYRCSNEAELDGILGCVNWKIINYLSKNWISIIREWATEFKPGKMIFMENTTNRVESFFGHFKNNNEIKIEGLHSLLNLVKYTRQVRNTNRKEIRSNYIKNNKHEVGIDLIAV